MTFEALGWNVQWLEKFKAVAAPGLVPGRVVAEHRSQLRVATGSDELSAGVSGRSRKAAVQRSDLPGVGDFVALKLPEGDGPSTIEVVLPRTSALIRKASGLPEPQLLAANVDVVFIVTALGGDFNAERIKRYLALVQQSGATPVIEVNKSDLESGSGPASELAAFASEVAVHMISARERESTRVLDQYFEGNRTIALLGSSGVGKSTLTNQLINGGSQATQEVRSYDGRGRHTTTHRQLLVRPQGGTIVDTPGLRGLELWSAKQEPQHDFYDIEQLALQCRFSNCRHVTEPGCSVRAAQERGELDGDRLAQFMKSAGGSKTR